MNHSRRLGSCLTDPPRHLTVEAQLRAGDAAAPHTCHSTRLRRSAAQRLARQLERLVNDVAGLKDDMTVVMARLDRIDASTRAAVDRMDITTRGVLDELRAMHRRHDRLGKRVERLEDASSDAPS